MTSSTLTRASRSSSSTWWGSLLPYVHNAWWWELNAQNAGYENTDPESDHLSHGVTPPLQDKDLKQYMDDCGNIMSMHNVKVRTTRTNIYKLDQLDQVLSPFCMQWIKLITWRPYILFLSRSSCSKFYGGCRTVTRGKFSTGTWSLRTSSSTREENSNWLILVRRATAAVLSLGQRGMKEEDHSCCESQKKKNVQINCVIISSWTHRTDSVLPCCVNSPHVYLCLWWGWQVWRGPSLSRLKPTPMRWWHFGTGRPTFCWDHPSIQHRSTCGRCLYFTQNDYMNGKSKPINVLMKRWLK